MSDPVLAMLILVIVTLSLYALDAFVHWYTHKEKK